MTAIERVAEWLNQYGNAVNAVSTIIATVIAVVGIVVSCRSIGVANRANKIAQGSFDYSREKDRKEEERAQAVLVSAWATPDGDGYLANEAERKIVVTVCNGSFQPVYNAVISMGAIQGGAPELITGDDAVPIGTLLPGKYQVEVSKPTPGMCAKFNASLGFTDSKGLSWARDAKGKLFQLMSTSMTISSCPFPWVFWALWHLFTATECLSAPRSLRSIVWFVADSLGAADSQVRVHQRDADSAQRAHSVSKVKRRSIGVIPSVG